MQMEYIGGFQIFLGVLARFWPVWLALAIVLGASFVYKKQLGLYGQLFDSGVGIAGVGDLLLLAVHGDLRRDRSRPSIRSAQVADHEGRAARRDRAGVADRSTCSAATSWRATCSAAWSIGSQIVLIIAPAATAFALMVGITLGLPAGYYGGRIDSILSFLANLVLAFPVILLFYLLVTPGIMDTPIPYGLAGLFFLFPIIFFATLFWTRFKNRPDRLYLLLGLTLVIGGWIYAGLVFDADPLGIVPIDPNQLNIFVAVVFASSPGVFRIVRGLVMDIKTRDYVAAAQTRGESPWYIMLWEILPNARGPLIVDACLRIGYTTILLGTLGYFGLGLAPESPDWGTAIKDASRLLRSFIHPALPPTIALMSFVLGLNLLADALREQSMKD